jgi:hypothetical protein
MAFKVQILIKSTLFTACIPKGEFACADDAWDTAGVIGCDLISLNSNNVVTITNGDENTVFYDGSDWAKEAYLLEVRKL